MILLSIDPGARGCGCAWWVEGTLLHALYVASGAAEREVGPAGWVAAVAAVEAASSEVLGGLRPDGVIVEQMQVYTRGKGDPRDLLSLAAIGGGLFCAFSDARPIGLLPSVWKGQVPRLVMGNRIEKRLRDLGWWERVRVPKQKTHLNDVLHGVGLGLFCVDHGRV